MKTFKMLIAGEWIDRGGRAVEPVIDPATGLAFAEVVLSTSADLDRALASTQRGFEIWRDTPALKRSEILRRAASYVRRDTDEIARILTLEEGKPLWDAKMEIGFAADVIDWSAEEGKRAYGRIVPARAENVDQLVQVEPIGPVAAFVAWNYPAVNVIRKVASALGAGCSIVIKPSEETPGTAIALAERFIEAGLPADVWNIVFGLPAEVSQHLLASAIPKKVTFTGSVSVGVHLQILAAKTLKRCTMELGGHAPVVVFDDADIKSVVAMAGAAKFRNAGQICIAPSRFLVQQKAVEPFVAALAKFADGLKVGPGVEDGVMVGPLANARRLEAVEALVEDAVSKGAKIRSGGKRIGNAGFFYAPTVLSDVSSDANILTEEPFGPIAPVVTFDDEHDAVELANRTTLGLASYIFTADGLRARRVAGQIEAGLVGMNGMAVSTPETPFGGVNMSGYGHEGGVEGLEAYQRKKFMSLSYT
jgi:succinate-semialdehyde dehydrogenase/glutarate-semialdehyde dehydrogenase